MNLRRNTTAKRFLILGLAALSLTSCGPRFDILSLLDKAYSGPACISISESFPFTLSLNVVEARRRRMASALERAGILKRIEVGTKTAVFDLTQKGKAITNDSSQLCYGTRNFSRIRKLSYSEDGKSARVDFLVTYNIEQTWALDESFRGYIPLGYRVMQKKVAYSDDLNGWYLQ